MAIVRAFKGIRPVKELASKIAALPYDVMDSREARKIVHGNKYSFLHIDKAEIDLDESIDTYDDKVYEKASSNLNEMIENNVYIQDDKKCLYVYKQIMDGISQTGLVCCTAIDDYVNNIIKKHEFTRIDKEQDRIKHVDRCNANTGPIFLTYKESNAISKIINEWMTKEPVYDFVSEDGNRHIAWVIDNVDIINELQKLFRDIDYLYIADGHHRAASAVKVGLKRRKESVKFSGEEEYNYFLSILYPDSELRILDYNRIVKDLNGYSEEEFLNEIDKKFIIKESNLAVRPNKKHTFGMYLKDKWYSLEVREGIYNEKDIIEQLDVSILQNNILDPILGIKDVRTSNRIDFIGGTRGLEELERLVNEGMKVAFSMYPTTIKDVMEVADKGEVMPPKSTWFEPKPRSGLFIHKLQ